MCTRGIYQLKYIKTIFCDWGGSSKGTREFLQSDLLKEFISKNPQINCEFLLKRGSHPYIISTYINGYEKSQSLRNMTPEEVLNEFQRVRQSFGRKHLPHAGKKVFGTIKSVQGGWKPNMWENYPQHELERIKILPPYEDFINKEEIKQNLRVKNPNASSQKDRINKIFKEKKWLEEI